MPTFPKPKFAYALLSEIRYGAAAIRARLAGESVKQTARPTPLLAAVPP